MTAGLDNSSLMSVDGTERTAAETTPAAYDAEFHFLQRRNSAFFVVHGMPLSRVRQVVNRIHLRFCQRHGRRILYYI